MAPAGGMHPGLVAEHIGKSGTERPGVRSHHGAGRLRAQPRTVAKQLSDGHLPRAGAGKVLLQRIVQIEQTLVAQPQHQDGRKGLR